MNPSERWLEVRRLFEACLDRPAGERTAYLAERCGGDAELQGEVERLLHTDDRDERGMIDTGPSPKLVTEGLQESLGGGEGGERLGRIGGYEIRRVLGSGGMGTVYEAVQQNPQRVVALKTLRLGLHSEEVRSRFDYESRILARLRHPGIAQIYEAGTYPDPTTGIEIPYFAMEFVDAASTLDQYAANRELDVRAILKLFVQICAAVQYGHNQGFIHRDLKPANILVDGEGHPKIIDFGIARATGESTTAIAMQTKEGGLLGTLRYMSPEQLEADSDQLDNRADVYALGVTLYELLTGRPPFDVGSKSITAAAETIRDSEPPRPSSHGARTGDRIGVELDWIVMKAMGKDRQLRYASVADFAADIGRFLSNEPVFAGPPSTFYRARKFARRHRLVIASVASVVLAVSAVMAWESVRRASERRQEAQASLRSAREKIIEYRTLRASIAVQDSEISDALQVMDRMYLEPAAQDSILKKQDEINAARHRFERLFHQIQDLLIRAERLNPEIKGTIAARQDLYMEKWREADTLRQGRHEYVRAQASVDRELFRRLIEEAGGRDRFRHELVGTGSVSFVSSPVGATVWMFRYREQNELFAEGEARTVPCPIRLPTAELPVRPGSWGLRVVRGQDTVRASETIFEVAGFPIEGTMLVQDPNGTISRLISIDGHRIHDDWEMQAALGTTKNSAARTFVLERNSKRTTLRGASLAALDLAPRTPRALAEQGGVPARVLDVGKLRSIVLPQGLSVRVTAAPLIKMTACRFDSAQTTDLSLPSGDYLALVQLPGHEPRRIPFAVSATPQMFTVHLFKEGTSPDDFVAIRVTPDEDVWVMDREVNCAEYLEFLNDPVTLAEITVSKSPCRFPRYPDNQNAGGYWPKGADGRYRIAKTWDPRWPILGVSWQDAMAYARWRTERARRQGVPFCFSLPTRFEWETCGTMATRYVFGERFLPHWVKSCFARPTPTPEPVLSFPVDETRWGLFDLSGSACEWLDSPYGGENDKRKIYAGGSWATAARDRFRLGFINGTAPHGTAETYGFRLVARRNK